MTKWICNKCMAGNPCSLNFIGTSTIPKICPFIGTDIAEWRTEESDRKEPEQKQEETELPKLTAEVFDRPDCPKSALWATVDEDGTAYFHLFAPMLYADEWQHTNCCKKIPGKWDATNWTEIIQRPEKTTLPDWCKNGALAWENGDYFELEVIDEDHQITMKYSDGTEESVIADYIGKHVKQARLRPYNAEEMRGLVGKVVSTERDCGIITGYRGVDNKVIVACENIRYSAEALLEIGATIDGKPCGVLEHLENGEWKA